MSSDGAIQQFQPHLCIGCTWPGVMWPMSGRIHWDQLWKVWMHHWLMQWLVRCDVWHQHACISRCASGYYGNPQVVGGTCVRCKCNGNVDINEAGHCDTITGECLRCKNNTAGRQCEVCRAGYYGDAVVAKDCQGKRFIFPSLLGNDACQSEWKRELNVSVHHYIQRIIHGVRCRADWTGTKIFFPQKKSLNTKIIVTNRNYLISESSDNLEPRDVTSWHAHTQCAGGMLSFSNPD